MTTRGGLAARVALVRGGFALDAGLDALPGETVAVMGPSGAGKSTLLDVIAGRLRPDAGEVWVGGRVVTDGPRLTVPAARRGVVLLGQEPRLFPHLSAAANIAFGLRARGVSRARATADAEGWLDRVGLAGLGARRPAALSGGQQQRVALARALATRPDVLLLDEPLTSLDVETAAGIRAELATLLPETTAVLVTHDALDAVALAARLVVVEGGAVAQEGPVREVLAAPATSFVAAAAGLERVVGRVTGGVWRTEGIALAAGGVADGPAAAVFAPAAVEIVPSGGTVGWEAGIARLEPTPAGVRVRTDTGVAADLPLARVAALALAPGSTVRLHVAPEAVRFLPLAGE